jgi:hypothetical protein|tara:strand:+ start:129 stop:566 length:438 start_codon:yes stop_codon:yes gene_type:complete
MSKEFKVAAVSDNTNSFGLYGMVLVAKDGESWKAGANSINVPKKGDVVTLDESWAKLGFEIPEQMNYAPPHVIKLIWGAGKMKTYGIWVNTKTGKRVAISDELENSSDFDPIDNVCGRSIGKRVGEIKIEDENDLVDLPLFVVHR